jgi:hypothetical protein
MKFDPEFAATVLLEAVFTSDRKACEKFNITDRTLRNYRARLNSDADFSALFQKKKALLDRAWADDLTATARKAARFIGSVAESDEPSVRRNPVMVHAMAGALKICVDAYLTNRVIDARLADQDRPADSVPGQVPEEPLASAYEQ